MIARAGRSKFSGSAGAFLPVVTALLLLLFVGQASAQGFDRFFTTFEQRQQLDIARREALAAPNEAERPDTSRQPTGPAPMMSSLIVNGYVIRSSGENMSWINGTQVSPGSQMQDGMKVERAARGVRIKLPSGIDTVELAAGQKIDVLSGKVVDVYERSVAKSASDAFAVSGTAPRRDPLGNKISTGSENSIERGVLQPREGEEKPGSVEEIKGELSSPIGALRRLLDRALEGPLSGSERR